MTIFLVTFLVMGIAVLAMAVGVLLGRRPIGGSCGGLDRLGLECDAGCDKPCPERLAFLRAQDPSRTLQPQLTSPDREGERGSDLAREEKMGYH